MFDARIDWIENALNDYARNMSLPTSHPPLSVATASLDHSGKLDRDYSTMSSYCPSAILPCLQVYVLRYSCNLAPLILQARSPGTPVLVVSLPLLRWPPFLFRGRDQSCTSGGLPTGCIIFWRDRYVSVAFLKPAKTLARYPHLSWLRVLVLQHLYFHLL